LGGALEALLFLGAAGAFFLGVFLFSRGEREEVLMSLVI
jgi:hypothetical protein